MAILDILTLPDKRLKTIAEPVTVFDGELKKLTSDMLETMYDAPGVGLAATQVNVHKQVVVIDVSEEKDQPLCLINPKIISKEGVQTYEEGCLSVPNIYAKVKRAGKVEIEAQDVNGEKFCIEAEELLAVCIQHELDHLKGIVFLDHLSPLKRKMALKKLEKAEE
ncbi:MAG TPA: peptide deformylase [Gammaproteobacteria bacterium]|nr:peptide deformylase [Xanthomonadales bacterium]HOP22349.1 peptide deformylase [Gammaproteobacteria bacterium]HPI94933.1 peptide deformylase [Gammaproteobacteria bacterium]HPQ86199.1 peptide deformylase [Gammaproteobacteria bacterium]